MKNETNWSAIINEGTSYREVLTDFATGKATKNYTLSYLAQGELSTDLRNLVRRVGTQKARTLARKALKRRGLLN